MSGDFRDERIAEHNFRHDVFAAKKVFDAPFNGGLNLTKKMMLVRDDREAIRASGPLGEALAREMEIWWDFIGRDNNTPHDPTAAMYLARPDLYDSTRASVRIDDGRSWAEPTPDGRVLILDVDAGDAVQSELVRRLTGAGSS